jgi:hypothetical protein
VRRLVLAIVVLCLAAAPAGAFLRPVTLTADLDGDGDDERVEAVRVDLEGVDDMFDRTAIRVSDSCAGQTVRRRIAGPQDNVALLRLKPIDSRRGREVFVDMRSGASGRLGEGRVVAWRRRGPCSGPRALFTYRSDRPTRAPAGARDEISFFGLRVRELARRYRGTELVLREQFLRRGEPGCCGSVRKTTLLRYSRAKDRYVVYRVRIRRDARG